MMIEKSPTRFRLAPFRPKILESLRGYNKERLLKDLMAGLTVGVVSLSLCIGLGIASGVGPGPGLYAGIVGGFLISLFGGSRVQVGGPAGAFVGLMALMVAKYGVPNVLVCTMMAGVILIVMGLLRIGSFIRFVPQPVTAGFTCGIAITILTTQIRPFLGLNFGVDALGATLKEPAEFFPKMIALFKALPTVSPVTVVLGVLLFVLLLRWPKHWGKRIPASIIAVLAGMAWVGLTHLPGLSGLGFLQVETIGSAFPNGIPQGGLEFSWPEFDWGTINALVSPAFAIALLCALESLLSAVVADGLIDDRHDSNQELMGQGIANLVTPLFGGIAVTGVIARTATNIRAGATSPVAGMVHAAFLLLVVIVAAPLVVHIPLVALAAVLIMVAWRMGEWEEFRRLHHHEWEDSAVFLVTFGLTVCFDLTVAVKIGMLLAAILFVKRVADTTRVNTMSGDAINHSYGEDLHVPEGVIVYRIFGALLFGAADRLDNVLRRESGDIKVVILHMASMSAMDATALDRLENIHAKMKMHKLHLIICGAQSQCYAMLARSGFLTEVGLENVMPDLRAAVERARILIEEKGNPSVVEESASATA